MRLRSYQANVNCDELREFSDWILSISEGVTDIGGHALIEIPKELLIYSADDPIAVIVNSTLSLLA